MSSHQTEAPSLRGSSGPATTSCPSTCPKCSAPLRVQNLNGLRAHLAKAHGITAEEAYLIFRDHPGPCVQCSGPVKFISFQFGYERLCGKCNKKNSQLRGAANRKLKMLPAWNKGLTEETSESVRKATQGCRDYIKENGHWRTGQTKENNEAIAKAAEKISIAQKIRWETGTHGMIGKNASNHEGIARRGKVISSVFLNTDKHWSYKSNAADVMIKAIATRRKKLESGELSPYKMSKETIDSNISIIRENWEISEFEFKGHQTPVSVKCKTCQSELTATFSSLYKGKLCPACYPSNFSKWHRELFDFFVTLDPNATVNNRKLIAPLELDVVSSNCKFAIECNGLYWHSEAMNTPPDYHQDKSVKAQEKGISLLHVFEDEWHDDNKREIVKSMIRVKLGMANRTFARKLSLHEGRTAKVAKFLAENHLDGNAPASKAMWLEDSHNNIVCALTLRKPHQQSKWGSKTIELARIATAKDTVVVGGMSRLIESAKQWAKGQNYDCMLTYRDVRLGGSGDAYKASGFTLQHVTKPRFWWTDGQYRVDRFAVRAIPGIATQEEMAMEHRLFKIFGCSNAVYVLKL